MRLAHVLSYIVSGLVVVFFHGYALADEPRMDSPKILAVVPVRGGNVDKNVYRQFDLLVPELKKIFKNKIIKLECRYYGRPERKQDVDNAYKLAARIEKYLRTRHKLDLDLWIAIDITPKSAKTSPVLTMAVYSDDMKKLEAVQINPQKN